jgi:hypothetical protein
MAELRGESDDTARSEVKFFLRYDVIPRIETWMGPPNRYTAGGYDRASNKNITLLTETLSKLRFLWSFHLFGTTIR